MNKQTQELAIRLFKLSVLADNRSYAGDEQFQTLADPLKDWWLQQAELFLKDYVKLSEDKDLEGEILKGFHCPYPREENASCPRQYRDKSCQDCRVKYYLALFQASLAKYKQGMKLISDVERKHIEHALKESYKEEWCSCCDNVMDKIKIQAQLESDRS